MARTCKCGAKFTQYNSLQTRCVPCAIAKGQKDTAAKAKRDWVTAQKADRVKRKERKQALKTKGEWKKEAQTAFNKFIRLRDRDEDCISCGRTNADVEPTDGWKVGGAWDCGHFQGVGKADELRYEETNAHKQCKSCNAGSAKYARKGGTVEKEYEWRLRLRIGDERVDWLKGPHEQPHRTIEDIKAIKAKYQAKVKELEGMLACG